MELMIKNILSGTTKGVLCIMYRTCGIKIILVRFTLPTRNSLSLDHILVLSLMQPRNG